MATSKSRSYRIDWYGNRINKVISTEVKRRVGVATTMLKGAVISNISVGVGIGKTKTGGTFKIRSKPGEFPRRDFGKLIATMMSGVERVQPDVWEGFVGTPLEYGATLETVRDRSFLVRTLFEESVVIRGILIAPMKV